MRYSSRRRISHGQQTYEKHATEAELEITDRLLSHSVR
jgi:hypothetical protein